MAVTPEKSGRRWPDQSQGFSLIETVIILAVAAILVPAVLTAIGTTVRVTDSAYDRSILYGLAQSQFEDVQRQTFQTSPASYTLISMPAGYSVSVATASAVTYTYPAPSSSNTVETVQQVTVTVSGVKGNLTVVGNKAR